jgi:aspartate aminotransferase
MVAEFKKRRDLICRLLNEVPGFHCAVPDGTFYAFPSYDMKMTSVELGNYLLDEAHIAVTAGSAFGPHGEGFIRMSFATSMENIKKGVEQMTAAIGKLKK